jgi:FkbM family methyltransferase
MGIKTQLKMRLQRPTSIIYDLPFGSDILKWWYLNHGRKDISPPRYLNYIHNKFNPALFNVLNDLQDGKGVIIDGGAHKGNFTSLFRHTHTVHAYEPAPETYKYLFIRFEDYKNVKLHKEALYDVNMKLKLRSLHSTSTTGSIIPNNDILKDKHLYETQVKTVNFVSEIRKILKIEKVDRIACIKLDIEGSEYQCLFDLIEGNHLLLDKINLILVEDHSFINKLSKYKSKKLKKLIKEYKLEKKILLNWW